MKVIFLDIDGVLNHQAWYKNAKGIKGELKHFDPECVKRLNKITDSTDSKIVLSSTWRKGKTINDIYSLFEKVGITGELIGLTPVINFSNWNHSMFRGCEIQCWMEASKGKLGKKLQSWNSYVIIDDDSDMLYWQRKNFFQTDPSGGGLTVNLTYKIINFLKS